MDLPLLDEGQTCVQPGDLLFDSLDTAVYGADRAGAGVIGHWRTHV
jgi:hypothetical protein